MPSRFYLPASGTAAVSPTISADWEHSSAIRRPMSTTKGSTALVSTAYTPDGADHLVNGDALHVQFVSDRLSAQTIAAQTVSLSIKGLMAHANNAQFLTWKLFIWTAADAVGPTLLAIRRDATAYTTTLINRTDSATTTGVTVSDGDRLVLEIGTGGTPTAAGGTQGHNATLRWGESGATDAPANDTATSTTENPWLEFANTLLFVPPPATSGDTRVQATARIITDPEAGHRGVARLSGALSSALVIAVRARRAVVSWAQIVAPVSLGYDLAGALRLSGTAKRTTSARKDSRATVAARVSVRTVLTPVTGYAYPSALRIRSRVSLAATKVVPGFSEGDVAPRISTRLVMQARSERVADAQLVAAASLLTPEALADRWSSLILSAMSGLGSPSASLRATEAILDLRALPISDLQTYEERRARANLWTSLGVAMAATRAITIQLPFNPLAAINLGHVYRGDTLTLPIWRATDRQGNTIDLTGASLWFTAKTDLSDIDAEAPTIQVSTADGGIVVIDADDGLYQVTLQPNHTQGLTGNAVFTFDVQVVTSDPVTRTVRWGTLVVVCDVTRAVA